MAGSGSDEGGTAAHGSSETVVVRRRPRLSGGRRIAAIAALGLLVLLVAALAAVWIARRPIASDLLEREFEKRGVQATYRLDRVGLRTQQVSNLVIGDPARPDLTARLAQIQMRVKWNGGIEVYRIVARGVRLRGRIVRNKVSWGQIDKLLPPPTGKPFALPDFVVDIADTSISLATPVGPLGIAVQGAGNLTGGFRGQLAAASPLLVPGRCRLSALKASMRVEITARRPHVRGPLSFEQVRCPSSRFEIVRPRFDVDSRFNESFTNYDGRGRMAIASLTAGENGLAQFAGNLTFRGDPDATFGSVELSAQRSRLAAIFAERTRLKGRYRLGVTGGTLAMVGNYAADSATLAPAMLAGMTGPLASVAETPIGPIATAIGRAISATTRNFDARGSVRMVNFAGGGAVRIETADVASPNGARVRVGGSGDGITYYWPSNRIRIDGGIQMAGGGLPTGRIALSQPRNGAPMSGTATFAPYAAGEARLALAPIRFAAGRDGSTQVSTTALLDGPFGDGRVQGLRVPISARFGSGGDFALGSGCTNVQFASLRSGVFTFGPTSLPVCPTGRSIVSRGPDGGVSVGARVASPALNGRIGSSPFRLNAGSARIDGKRFDATSLAMRLGRPEAPIIFDAAGLNGTFAGSGITGMFAGAKSTIGNVPVALSAMDGRWRVYQGDISVAGAATVADRADNPRFYPMRSTNMAFSLADGMVKAGGTLRHPASGTAVTDVAIQHVLATGAGFANLDVPGIRFGQGLQPEELTRLSEGVIALVEGTVTGRGRIEWSGGGKVTSTGEFSTAGMNLAAPFGPVTGLTTTVRFTDLLGLETAPGQTAQIASINPGILVEGGAISYQLMSGQRVRVQRGDWPFMGGRLILQETVLNFGRPSAKRLTFEVVGLDANTFVTSLGFKEIGATGVFDGVLPMIFDESGGRIVGGRLDSRPGGGTLSYNGVVNRANLGLMGGIAFDALRDLRFRSMIIRLDGDLAGEFGTRLTIDGVGLGQSKTASLLRAIYNLPLKFNVNIRGPFRALIATAKSYSDPRARIAEVLPRPLEDVPGIVTTVRRREETTTQTQTPVNETIDVTATPAPTSPSER